MELKKQDLGLAVGAKLKRLIKEFGTQEDFADKFNVDVRTVRRWIKDGVDSLTTLTELAEFFNMGVKDFLP